MPCRATDELGFVPLSKTGAELLLELISRRYERGATIITSNLPFDEWTAAFGDERLTHHVHILEMNAPSCRLEQSRGQKDAKPKTLSMRAPLAGDRRLRGLCHLWLVM
jgi:hypothetical protein